MIEVETTTTFYLPSKITSTNTIINNISKYLEGNADMCIYSGKDHPSPYNILSVDRRPNPNPNIYIRSW